ncbi:hypothetical protein Q8A73_004518 [Channa argus]|nr:hypothetical protein Q8A73_004518 [Channa argus]
MDRVRETEGEGKAKNKPWRASQSSLAARAFFPRVHPSSLPPPSLSSPYYPASVVTSMLQYLMDQPCRSVSSCVRARKAACDSSSLWRMGWTEHRGEEEEQEEDQAEQGPGCMATANPNAWSTLPQACQPPTSTAWRSPSPQLSAHTGILQNCLVNHPAFRA